MVAQGFRSRYAADSKATGEGIMQDNNARQEWIEPKIESLDVEETNLFPLVGRDGGRNPDSLRS